MFFGNQKRKLTFKGGILSLAYDASAATSDSGTQRAGEASGGYGSGLEAGIVWQPGGGAAGGGRRESGGGGARNDGEGFEHGGHSEVRVKEGRGIWK